MPRPSKKHPITRETLLIADILAKTKDDPLGHLLKKPALLRSIALALVKRLARNDRERQLVERLIHGIAVIERMPKRVYSPSEKQDTQGKLIAMLGNALVPKHQHEETAVQFQRNWLAEYLKVRGCPLQNARNVADQQLWLREHESEIIQLLSICPCLCDYATSLRKWVDDRADNMKRSLTEKEIIVLTLAALHGTTDNGILHLLKRSSPLSSPRSHK